MKYDILLFDADNTLFDFNACEKIAFESALAEAGIPFVPGMTETYSKINLGLWKALERGEIGREALKVRRFADFLSRYGLTYDPAALARVYEDSLSRTAVILPGAKELLEELYGKASVYVVTNGLTHVQRGRFSRSPLTKYVDGLFISEEIGANKPDKLYFDRVAARIPRFDPARALVVGDSLSSDIKGANNAGLHCVWFDPFDSPDDGEARYDARVKNFEELKKYLFET